MKRDLTFLILLTVALHFPFTGEAFHLDDAQYLDVALNVGQNPFFPMDLPSGFKGHHNELGRSLKLVEHVPYRIRSLLRVLDPHSHAGFWSDGWAFSPSGSRRNPWTNFRFIE